MENAGKIETVQVIFEVPKESKEIVDPAILAAQYVIKKEWAKLATLVDDGIKAADGASAVVDEVKSEHMPDLAGYMTREILKAFKA